MNDLMRQTLLDNYSVYENNGSWFQANDDGDVPLTDDDLKVFTDYVLENASDFGYAREDFEDSNDMSNLSPKEQKKLLKMQKKEEKRKLKEEKKAAKLQAKEEKRRAKSMPYEQELTEEYSEDFAKLSQEEELPPTYEEEFVETSAPEETYVEVAQEMAEDFNQPYVENFENQEKQYQDYNAGYNQYQSYDQGYNQYNQNYNPRNDYNGPNSGHFQRGKQPQNFSLENLANSDNNEVTKSIASNISATQNSISSLKKLLEDAKKI